MLKVLLRSPFSPFTGYGNDGLGIVKALLGMGVDLTLDPIVVTPPVTHEVAALLTKGIDNPPYDILLHCADPATIGLATPFQRIAHKTVLWTMWEWRGFGEELTPLVQEKVQPYDLVVSYDQLTDENFDFLPASRRTRVQGGYDPVPWMPHDSNDDVGFRDWSPSATFRYCMVGALTGRKNPMMVVRAFKELKEEHGDEFNAELHLKTNTRTLHPGIESWAPGVKIHYAKWSVGQLRMFYRSCHAYVAPSLGEGKNMPALEAGTTGMALILSQCSGHMEWADPSMAYFVDGAYEPTPGDKNRFHMGIDEGDLKAKMWHVYMHRMEASMKGMRASAQLPNTRAWSSVMPRVIDAAMRASVSRDVEHRP